MFFLHNFKKLIKSNSILTVIAHTLIEKFHFLYSEKEYFLTNAFPYVEKNRTDNDYIMFKFTKNKFRLCNIFSKF